MGVQMEMSLAHAQDIPPFSIIATAALVGVPLKTDPNLPSGSPPALSFSTGEELHGTGVVLRYLGRIATLPDFYNRDALSTAQIDEWLEYAPIFSSGADFEKACTYVDNYLSLRTFLVGYNLSVADIAIWSGLAGAGQRWEGIRKSKKYQNLVRWFNSILSEYPILSEVVDKYVGRRGIGKPKPVNLKESELNGIKNESNEKAKEEGSFDIDLPDAEMGKVCTRFPPEPSGYLHIGHAKAAFLNQYFAQRYKGRLIIRFDDTNPAKESSEFVENILSDLDTLGIKGEGPTYTSDYFPQLVEMAEKLISEGKAYVDDTPREQMQKERMDGIESINRNNSVEQNMCLWKEMIAATERGMQCCLRGKLDMQAVNKTLRDPVYYRCNPIPHHRVGSKYKIYPTYDFACPYVDSIEGVTHALRSSEYHDRNEQYYRVLEDMGLRKVHVWDFSRLNFVYTLLSKRKLQWFVDNGKVEGWDDPRFPTVQGTLRRGLTVEALKQFILSQGASKNLNLMEWDKLWTINKKIIDPVCPRHTALFENRVLLCLTNGPEEAFVRILPRHKKYEGAGNKATTYTKRIWLDGADAALFSEGEEVTLMDWGNAIIKNVEKDTNGVVVRLHGMLHLEGSVKTTKLKLTWLPEISELVNLSLVEVDHLITKKKLEETDNFLEVLNPCTRWETAAVGDANMRNLKKGEILQLERKGYFRCDVPYLRQSKPVVLIAIPDGRQQSVMKRP
ncbi:glutamate--tRNA ligase, cytoplasmic isoform X1 [Cryptomeria japonica]|uniref:glutamate--tRNA ligase, cytoplasmic isoform X1 n=2 Tax=Cryptomeria japonica TaxID=3369 RepID=UPI0027DA5BF6|nr:glutamate--tRNA ligase, cytoplasmic isoform X1 [Cryptomeria japonica]